MAAGMIVLACALSPAAASARPTDVNVVNTVLDVRSAPTAVGVVGAVTAGAGAVACTPALAIPEGRWVLETIAIGASSAGGSFVASVKLTAVAGATARAVHVPVPIAQVADTFFTHGGIVRLALPVAPAATAVEGDTRQVEVCVRGTSQSVAINAFATFTKRA